jgi:hypothetical protein
VAVIFADEAPPAAFDRTEIASAAAALHLSADEPARGALARLPALRPGPAEAAPSFANNPIAPALDLVRAIAGRRAGPFPAGSWLVDVEPA